ncbi:AsmA family protein [Actibacterium sp. D379-3]
MRWLVRVIFTLLLLVALLAGALLLLPADKIAGLASDQIRKATGRELTLTGRLKPSIWPQIGVATGPVTLSNAGWASDTPMVQADALEIGLDLAALLGGDIVIRNLELTAPRILLERASDGRGNWQIEAAETGETTTQGGGGQGGGGAPAAKDPAGFTLDKAVITGGTLTFIDHAAGTTRRADALEATVTLPAFTGPGNVALSAQVNGQPVTARAELAGFATFLSGAVTGVTADLTAGKARVGFKGRAGTAPLVADGALTADLSDLAALSQVLGSPPPALPPGMGDKIAVAGQVTYAPEGSVHLRGGTFTLGGNTLTGAADLFPGGARPRLNGQFTTGVLDLSAFAGAGAKGGAGGTSGGTGGGGKARSGWSSDPIDVSALGLLDAELAITADSVDLGKTRLGRSRVLATLTDRRLVFDLREVRAYGGLITGNFVVNGRGGLSVGGDLTVAGLAVQQALRDLAGYERLSTSADMTLKFLGSGNSVNAIMNSLSGGGAVALGAGVFTGLDLERILRGRDMGGAGGSARTIFDSVAGRFTLAEGVLRNDDLTLLAPRLTAGGRGTVGIGKRVLDYRVTPVAFAGDDGKGGLKVPLRITGGWDDPQLKLDLESVADKEIDKQVDKLRDKAGEELGLDAESGESLEDAAKRKAQEEVIRGLKNLLK